MEIMCASAIAAATLALSVGLRVVLKRRIASDMKKEKKEIKNGKNFA